MKSTAAQLEARGYATERTVNSYRGVSNDALRVLLRTGNAAERTAAAVLIGERRTADALLILCDALQTETKLYTKIALCDAIAHFGTAALLHLIPLLGRIGGNQHAAISAIDLKKRSFPLPRDIAARIVIRIGSAALPSLEEVVEHGRRRQMLEAVDAIGHITFTQHDYRSESVLLKLYSSSADELMRWKVIRAFQSFVSTGVESVLRAVLAAGGNAVLAAEARRSLDRMERRRTGVMASHRTETAVKVH